MVIVLVLLFPVGASTQVIRFAECTYNATPFVPFNMPLIYEGPQEITGAIVRITGFPAEWSVAAIPPFPLCEVPCGDPFGDGIFLAWPSCQDKTVQLLQISVLPLTAETDLVITPEKAVNSPVDYPAVSLCDAPVFTIVCTECDRSYINHSNPSCSVAVEELTWSQVRNVYR